MADKTIGALPSAPAVYDDSLFVAEQQGAAVKVTGRQIRALLGTGGGSGNGGSGGSGSGYSGGGFVEMTASIPVENRVNNTLYGLILKTFN